MPQISKCRIVNFWYNDGSRLIADELYDFGSLDSTKARSVLIDMENGIGKTVLLQLMLQPVVPKAKIAGRRIEDFFTKGTYHSYILLEWFKDNSTEKLLTGISIAASDSMSQDDDSKGRGIKYYTFFTNYSGYDKYSIENLELSRKENGRFVPAAFDEVRNLGRKNRGRITCYSSDDSLHWKTTLQDYGIVQAEWNNIMVALNQKEGGISTYFEQFKKSDKIVDELLIPTVEGRFSEEKSRDEDNSLETMLITYAKRYSQQKDFLEEREVSEKLSEQLKDFRTVVENLWEIKDQFDSAKGTYFSFYAQLETVRRELNTTITELEEQSRQKDQQILHIQTEQASADYYLADEKYQTTQDKLKQLEADLGEAQSALKKAREIVKIMDCALLCEKIRQKQAEQQAIQKTLDSKQEQSAQNAELKSLRYSVWKQLETLMPEQKSTSEKLGQELEKTEKEQKELQEKVKAQKSELQTIEAKYAKQEGHFEELQKQTDSLVTKMKLPVNRLFFAGYSKQDLETEKKKKEEEQDKIVESKAKLGTLLNESKTQRDNIPGQRDQLVIERGKIESKQERKQQELDIYLEKEAVLFNVCDRYNMEHSGCFNGVLCDYLKNRKIQEESNLNILNRKLETIRRQITAAERGSLHILNEIEEYLENRGVEYQPCEKYLLSLVQKGNLASEKCMEILQKVPSLAFGIVTSDRETILKNNNTDWLPAILPIFTYQDIQSIFKGEAEENRSLALYSENYFESHETFLEELKKQEEELDQESGRAYLRLEKIEKDLHLAEDFDYAEEWKNQLAAELKKLANAIQTLNQKITELDQELRKLQDLIEQTQDEINNYENELRSFDSWLENYEELIQKIHEEEEAGQKLDELNQKANDLKKTLQQTNKLLDQTSLSLEDLSEKKDKIDDLLARMQDVSAVVCDAEETTIQDSDWELLYGQYQSMTRLLGEEQQKLLYQLDKIQDELKAEQKQLKNTSKGLLPAQYENEKYSDSVKQKAQEEAEKKETEVDILQDERSNLYEVFGNVNTERKTAKEKLQQLGQELLPKEEVGTDFENRIGTALKEKSELNQDFRQKNKRKQELEREYGRVEDRLKSETKPERIPEISIRIDEVSSQNNELYNDFFNKKNLLGNEDSTMQKKLGAFSEDYKDSYSHIQEFFRNLKQMAEKESTGDRYFSMGELIDGVLASLELRIHQITGDLEDFDKSKEDLIRQCLLQARKILNGLNGIQNHSKIQVYEGRQNVQMIRMPGLPKEVDEAIARQSIENEIDKGTVELAAKMQEDGITENDLRKKANQIVGSKQLIRKYIQKDHIRLDAYKVDKNPENAQHRTWEETQTENSGAQKFLVYFSIMVAIIAYNRSETGALNTKEQTSVLILDNPFGPITSAYALKPMFALAHKLNVQMICLSNITLCDITVCFEKVIKAVLHRQPLSSIEMLTHDQNEQLEHGFYESEQLTLDFLGLS